MKTKKYFSAVVTVWFLMVVQLIQAQKNVQFIPAQSQITIKGTSNLHDWEESVQKFNVILDLNFNEKQVTSIEKVHVNLKSNSIVSENNIMTNKTHEALRVEKYPDIDFKLVSVDKLSSADGKFSGTLTGDVTLSGITKRITVPFSGVQAAGKITIKGSKELSMSDFNIKPPTAMLGTLKTGNEVTISFQLNFQIT